MDTRPRARDTVVMDGSGAWRTRIEQTLAAAYGDGLLSDTTFIRRIDALAAAGHVVDPEPLIGDLSLRAKESTLTGMALRLATMLASTGEALRRTVMGAPQALMAPRTAPVLLELDWDGAEDELLVGRHHACDVVIDDLTVSRHHARLRFRDGRWILQDLESTNGTLVNGAPIGRCHLRPGDELALGECRLVVD